MAAPLDAVASVTGAWSLSRDMLTAFAGGTRYTKTGTAIITLEDQSGNNRDFTDGGLAARRPTETTAFPASVLCADFSGVSTNTMLAAALSNFISASSGAVIVSVIVDAVTTNDAVSYHNHPIIAENAVYMGLYARNLSGVTFYAYDWDGAEKAPSTTGTVGTAYVLMWRHHGGNQYVSVNGGTEVSVASGNTQVLTGLLALGGNNNGLACNCKIAEAFTTSDGSQTAALAAAIANLKAHLEPPVASIQSPLVTDTDAIYAAAVLPTQLLLPALFSDTDTFYAPSVTPGAVALAPALFSDADAFYTATVTPGTITLAPAAVSDTDAFYTPSIANTTQFLQPAVVSDTDTFSVPTVAAGATLLSPTLVVDADTIPASTIAYLPLLRPALVPADDAVYSAGTVGILILAPALLVDPDDIATVDAGWRLFGQLLVDVDLVLGPHVDTLTYLLPNVFEDGDTIDTYPFFIQAVTGGIPVPPPSGVLTGSISYPRRMTGTLDRRPRLTGSITRSTRVLTGSLNR
jgi:hypothetical protein